MENFILTSIPIEELKSFIAEVIQAELKKTQVTDTIASEYITRQETAKILGISLVTLNEWSKTGIITSYRIGTRVRYKRHEVEESLSKVKTIKR
jgi:excisionase family DNA binding protein